MCEVVVVAAARRHKKGPNLKVRALIVEICVRDLLSGAVDFHFDEVVHVVGSVAVAVEANVLSVGALGVDEFTKACVNVGFVGACALFGGVVVVVVEECGHSCREFRVVGDLHDDIVIGTRLRVVVPHPNGCQVGRGAEVDLHPLYAIHQFNEVAFTRFFVAIGDVCKLADDREVVAGDDWFTSGK